MVLVMRPRRKTTLDDDAARHEDVENVMQVKHAYASASHEIGSVYVEEDVCGQSWLDVEYNDGLDRHENDGDWA